MDVRLDQLTHTYSIVAYDRERRQLGVAVQSHWFAVGSVVTWAEAGVGAVATQAFTEVGYGPRGLVLMREGKTAAEALDELVGADNGRDLRQVAMVDAQGHVAAHTGQLTIAEAGHIIGDGFSVQANMMLNATVWPAMDDAYRQSEGDLAARMMAALEAAQQAGGDIRGTQSAALLIVNAEKTEPSWSGRLVDLRVDDSPNPLLELRRLLRIQQAYALMREANESRLGHGDTHSAAVDFERAEALAPDNLEIRFWHAVSLATSGGASEALSIFRSVFEQDRNWLTLALRLADAGLLPDGSDLLKDIRAQGRT